MATSIKCSYHNNWPTYYKQGLVDNNYLKLIIVVAHVVELQPGTAPGH